MEVRVLDPTTLLIIAAVLVLGALGLVAYLRAVRERLRREVEWRAGDAELRAREAKWRVVLENAPDVISILNREGRILFINKTEPAYTPEQVTGMSVFEFVDPEYQSILRRSLARVFEGRETVEVEMPSRKVGDIEHYYRARYGPLVEDGEVVGALLYSTDVTHQRELEELRARFLDRVVTVQEDERRRIARELHDATGQALTSLLIGLRVLEDETDAAAAATRIAELRAMTSQALEDVGRLARGLHPSVLDDLGFETALERSCADFSETHGLDLDLQLVGFEAHGQLEGALEISLYRIIQEALTNVAKHAAATTVSVIIERSRSGVRLIVEDDGHGFALSETGMPRHGTGLGLVGIRERAELAGGRLTIESTRKGGTSLYVDIPIASAEPKAHESAV